MHIFETKYLLIRYILNKYLSSKLTLEFGNSRGLNFAKHQNLIAVINIFQNYVFEWGYISVQIRIFNLQ